MTTVTVGGSSYTLKEMSGEDFDSFVRESKDAGPARQAALLVHRCLTGPEWAGKTLEDILQWPYRDLIALGNEAAKVNGLDKEATERAEKN